MSDNVKAFPPPNSEPLTKPSMERFRAVGTNYVVPAQELLTTVKIAPPGKETFIRTYPDPDPRMEFVTHTFATREEHRLIEPRVFNEIKAKVPDFKKFAPCVSLRPYITKDGSINLWPLKRENPFTIGSNSYNTSAFNAADVARSQWVRVSSDTDRGQWLAYPAEEAIAEPKWPEDLSMDGLLQLAAKQGVIDSIDHPLIKALRGIQT